MTLSWNYESFPFSWDVSLGCFSTGTEGKNKWYLPIVLKTTVECILFMGITLSSLTAASGVSGGWFCVHGGKYGVKPALVNKCSELPLVKPVFSCCLSILSSSDSSESNLMWLVSWLDSIESEEGEKSLRVPQK